MNGSKIKFTSSQISCGHKRRPLQRNRWPFQRNRRPLLASLYNVGSEIDYVPEHGYAMLAGTKRVSSTLTLSFGKVQIAHSLSPFSWTHFPILPPSFQLNHLSHLPPFQWAHVPTLPPSFQVTHPFHFLLFQWAHFRLLPPCF